MGAIEVSVLRSGFMQGIILRRIKHFFFALLVKSRQNQAQQLARKIRAEQLSNIQLLEAANFADMSLAYGFKQSISYNGKYYFIHQVDKNQFIVAVEEQELKIWILNDLNITLGINLHKDKPTLTGLAARRYIVQHCIK